MTSGFVDNGKREVAYEGLVGLLIKAVKELDSRLSALEHLGGTVDLRQGHRMRLRLVRLVALGMVIQLAVVLSAVRRKQRQQQRQRCDGELPGANLRPVRRPEGRHAHRAGLGRRRLHRPRRRVLPRSATW